MLILPVEERDVDSSGGGQADAASGAQDKDAAAEVHAVNGGQHDALAAEVHGEYSEAVLKVNSERVLVTKGSVIRSFRSCQMLNSRVQIEDYEKTVYLTWAEAFDWQQVFGEDGENGENGEDG